MPESSRNEKKGGSKHNEASKRCHRRPPLHKEERDRSREEKKESMR
jgi:hypothetical protein